MSILTSQKYCLIFPKKRKLRSKWTLRAAVIDVNYVTIKIEVCTLLISWIRYSHTCYVIGSLPNTGLCYLHFPRTGWNPSVDKRVHCCNHEYTMAHCCFQGHLLENIIMCVIICLLMRGSSTELSFIFIHHNCSAVSTWRFIARRTRVFLGMIFVIDTLYALNGCFFLLVFFLCTCNHIKQCISVHHFAHYKIVWSAAPEPFSNMLWMGRGE